MDERDDTPRELLYDEAAERALLGCAFVDDEAINLVADVVTPSDLWLPEHVTIWEAMLAVHHDGSPVDAHTLCDELTTMGKLARIGGPAYLDALIDEARRNIIPHPDEYARIIADFSWRRRVRDESDRLHRISADREARRPDIEKQLRRVERATEDSVDELPAILAEDLDAKEWPTKSRWMIDQWWLAQGVGGILGDPKSGKSVIAAAMCLAVVSGEPFLRRWTVPVTGPAIYVNAEDAEILTKPRVRKLRQTLGVTVPPGSLWFSCQQRCDLSTPHGRGRLAALVRRVRPVFVVLDCLKRLFGNINENHSSEVAPVLDWIRALQIETGAAFALVHHLSKAREFGEPANILQRIRGTGDIAAWLDSAIGMEWPNRKKPDHYMNATHRGAGDAEEVTINLKWDDENDELRLDFGEPRGKKSRQQMLKEQAEAFGGGGD
jgi:hypothetical protein